MKENSLFVEKYRSKTLDEYVGNEQLKQIVSKYIANNDLQNLLLYGTPGTGKTTLAKLITKNIKCDVMYINASDERGIDTIRDKIVDFASVNKKQTGESHEKNKLQLIRIVETVIQVLAKSILTGRSQPSIRSTDSASGKLRNKNM